ncbi:MAG: hypothetical protein ACE5IR_11860 [bacterium]
MILPSDNFLMPDFLLLSSFMALGLFGKLKRGFKKIGKGVAKLAKGAVRIVAPPVASAVDIALDVLKGSGTRAGAAAVTSLESDRAAFQRLSTRQDVALGAGFGAQSLFSNPLIIVGAAGIGLFFLLKRR